MGDARTGADHPFEAGLSAPAPYAEGQTATGPITHTTPEIGDSSTAPVEIDEMGDPVAEPLQTPATQL